MVLDMLKHDPSKKGPSITTTRLRANVDSNTSIPGW